MRALDPVATVAYTGARHRPDNRTGSPRMRSVLNTHQKRLLQTIIESTCRDTFQPSRQEMAAALEVSAQTIDVWLAELADAGYIDLAGGDRALRLLHLTFHAEITGLES